MTRRTASYTAHQGLIYGVFDRTGLSTLEARKRLANHAENAIAGVCTGGDETALELIADLISAIREAEAPSLRIAGEITAARFETQALERAA